MRAAPGATSIGGMNMPNPHKKPFIVALCFLIAGCLMLAAGPALV